METIRRTVILVAGMVLAALALGQAAPFLLSERGTIGPTLLQAQTPIAAIVAVIVGLAIASLVAGGVGRLTNATVGLFVLGFGLAMLALRCATIQELAISGGGGIVLVEGLAWCVLVLGAVLVVFRLSGPLADVEPCEDGTVPGWAISPDAGRLLLASLAILPVVWLVAQSTSKGQVLAAATLGAVGAGLLGRLLAPHVQPILLFAAPVLVGTLGAWVGAMMTGDLEQSYAVGAINPMALPTPIDYAAGSLMGVAVGYGWARSFLHHEDGPSGSAAGA
jgi:hypothetical protein